MLQRVLWGGSAEIRLHGQRSGGVAVIEAVAVAVAIAIRLRVQLRGRREGQRLCG